MKHTISIAMMIGMAAIIAAPLPSRANTLGHHLSGRVLLQVESRGEGWYVHPIDERRYVIGKPHDTMATIRKTALGISDANLRRLFGDTFENAFVLPTFDRALAARLAGRILLRVDHRGEVIYLDPTNATGYLLPNSIEAGDILVARGLGISNANLAKIDVGIGVPPPLLPIAVSVPPPAPTESATLRQFALDDINRIRIANGKPVLILNTDLSFIAEIHSRDMALHLGTLSHTGARGETARDRIALGKIPDLAGNGFMTAFHPDNVDWSGENIGMHTMTASTAAANGIASLHELFLNEPANQENHRATMLSTFAPFSEVGIGIFVDSNNRLWLTEDYITRQ